MSCDPETSNQCCAGRVRHTGLLFYTHIFRDVVFSVDSMSCDPVTPNPELPFLFSLSIYIFF